MSSITVEDLINLSFSRREAGKNRTKDNQGPSKTKKEVKRPEAKKPGKSKYRKPVQDKTPEQKPESEQSEYQVDTGFPEIGSESDTFGTVPEYEYTTTTEPTEIRDNNQVDTKGNTELDKPSDKQKEVEKLDPPEPVEDKSDGVESKAVEPDDFESTDTMGDMPDTVYKNPPEKMKSNEELSDPKPTDGLESDDSPMGETKKSTEPKPINDGGSGVETETEINQDDSSLGKTDKKEIKPSPLNLDSPEVGEDPEQKDEEYGEGDLETEGKKPVRYFIESFAQELERNAEKGRVKNTSGQRHETFDKKDALKVHESLKKAFKSLLDSKKIKDISFLSRSMYRLLSETEVTYDYTREINDYIKKNSGGGDYNMKLLFHDLIKSFIFFDMAMIIKWVGFNVSDKNQKSKVNSVVMTLVKRFAELISKVNLLLKDPRIVELGLDPDDRIKPGAIKGGAKNSEIIRLKRNVWKKRSQIEKVIKGSRIELTKYESYLSDFESAIKDFMAAENENKEKNHVDILMGMFDNLNKSGGVTNYLRKEKKLLKAIGDVKDILTDSKEDFDKNRKTKMGEIKDFATKNKIADMAEARKRAMEENERALKEAETESKKLVSTSPHHPILHTGEESKSKKTTIKKAVSAGKPKLAVNNMVLFYVKMLEN